MWLVNTNTITLEEFTEDTIPPYAILSHTWENEEVSFQAIQDPNQDVAKRLHGYSKVRDSCKQASSDNFKYIWIDTCCINKNSSAELSEAINSMFRWYRDADVCYSYLTDVPDDVDVTWSSSPFHRSKWFTRGWTLQELLAPSLLYFFTHGWKRLGSKTLLRTQVAHVTKVDEAYLCGEESIFTASVSKRMSWAAARKTTRPEDMAYCLLGLFDVNMPLLYGEGTRHFAVFREEIIKSSVDQTIFAWGYRAGIPIGSLKINVIDIQLSGADAGIGFLAETPSAFRDFGMDWVPDELARDVRPYTMTNVGLRMDVIRIGRSCPIWEMLQMFPRDVIVLACRPIHKTSQVLAIPVRESLGDAVVRFDSIPLSLDRELVERFRQAPQQTYLYAGLQQKEEVSPELRPGWIAHWNVQQYISTYPTGSDTVTFRVILRRVPSHFNLDAAVMHPADAYDREMRILGWKRRAVLKLSSDAVFLLSFNPTNYTLLAYREKADVGAFDLEGWSKTIHETAQDVAEEENIGLLDTHYEPSKRFTADLNVMPIRVKTRQESMWVMVLDIFDREEKTHEASKGEPMKTLSIRTR